MVSGLPGHVAAVLTLFAAPLLARSLGDKPLRPRIDDSLLLLQQTSGLAESALLGGDDTLRLTVRDERHRELHLEVRKSTRLGKLIDVVCKRLQLEKEYAMFVHDGKLLSQFDTVTEFGLQDEDVIEVSGGRVVRTAPRREVTTAAPLKTSREEQVVTTTAPARAAPSRLGPAPTPVFQVGDFTYVNISNSSGNEHVANTWAPCSVAGKGSKPNTYNIHFLYTPLGFRDLSDVPARSLRRVDGRRFAEAVQYYREDPDAIDQVSTFILAKRDLDVKQKEAAERAKEAAHEALANATDEAGMPLVKKEKRFEVGDFLEIRLEQEVSVSDTAGNISSLPCRLLGPGLRNGSYQVHFLFMPQSRADLTNITQDVLRHIGTKEFADRSLEMKRVTAEKAEEIVTQLEQEVGNRSVAEERRLARAIVMEKAARAAARADDEAHKRWTEEKEKAAADKAARDAADRKAKRDRDLAKRTAEQTESQRLANMEYEDNGKVEVKIEKTIKGTAWLPGHILRKGKDAHCYDVRFPWGPTDHQDVENIPTAFLRPPNQPKFDENENKFKTDAERALQAVTQAEKEAAHRMRTLAAEQKDAGTDPAPKPTSQLAPAVGDAAEIKTKTLKGLEWLPCTILSAGKRNSFNVRVDFVAAEPNKELRNVPKDHLRKVQPGAAEITAKLAADTKLGEAALRQLEAEAAHRERQEGQEQKKRQDTRPAAQPTQQRETSANEMS